MSDVLFLSVGNKSRTLNIRCRVLGTSCLLALTCCDSSIVSMMSFKIMCSYYLQTSTHTKMWCCVLVTSTTDFFHRCCWQIGQPIDRTRRSRLIAFNLTRIACVCDYRATLSWSTEPNVAMRAFIHTGVVYELCVLQWSDQSVDGVPASPHSMSSPASPLSFPLRGW